MRHRRLVLVFARTPRDEARAKPFGAVAHAERLHRALRAHALATAAAAGFATRLVTSGDDAPAVAPAVEIARQRGGSFAERLQHAVADAFADGWHKVVVIGADAPGLRPRHLQDAFARLDGGSAPRAVVGPARDGGFYLIGLDRFDASLFGAVRFCTPNAYADTAAALAAARFEIATLPLLDDVDTLDDVRALAGAPTLLGRLARQLCHAAARPPAGRVRFAPPPRVATADARGPPLTPLSLT